MQEVTQIKPQRNNKRVNIYLDGKFAFGLDLENFMKLGIKVGQEFTTDEINEIVKKGEFQKTLDKLLRFAMTRPRSTKEVHDWFRRKKVHESIHKDLFNRLKKYDLVGDEQFGEWWIRQRLTFKPRGKRALSYELRAKGLDPKLIKKLVEEHVDIDDEAKMAKELLEKKQYKWERYDDETKKIKKQEFLARKGFEWNVIKEAVK